LTRSVECGCLVRRLDVGIQDVGLAPSGSILSFLAKGEISGVRGVWSREFRCTVVPVVGGPMGGSFSHRHCPLSCYRCTVSLTLRLVLVVYSTRFYCIVRISDVYNTEAVNSAVRNHVSYNLQLSVCRNLAIHQTVYAYLHCLFYAIDSPLWRIVRYIWSLLQTRYLYISRIVIFNAVINTRLIYRSNALLFFPRLFFAPLHQRERKLSNTFTLFHPSIYS